MKALRITMLVNLTISIYSMKWYLILVLYIFVLLWYWSVFIVSFAICDAYILNVYKCLLYLLCKYRVFTSNMIGPNLLLFFSMPHNDTYLQVSSKPYLYASKNSFVFQFRVNVVKIYYSALKMARIYTDSTLNYPHGIHD